MRLWPLLLVVGASISLGVRCALSDPYGHGAPSLSTTSLSSTSSSSSTTNDWTSTTSRPSPTDDSSVEQDKSSWDTLVDGLRSRLPPKVRTQAEKAEDLVKVVRGITSQRPTNDEDESLTNIFARALRGSTGEYGGASRVLAALAGHSPAQAQGTPSQDDEKEQRGQSEALRALNDAVQASRTDSPDILAGKVAKAKQWLSDAIALDKSMNTEHEYMDETQRSLLEQAERVLQRLERKRARAPAVHEDL